MSPPRLNLVIYIGKLPNVTLEDTGGLWSHTIRPPHPLNGFPGSATDVSEKPELQLPEFHRQ